MIQVTDLAAGLPLPIQFAEVSGGHIQLTSGGRMRLPLAGAKTDGISAAVVIATTAITYGTAS